jgi:dihydrofolate reductase
MLMGMLIYTAIASLDGYVEDQDGRIDWFAPDDEFLRFITDLERPLGTYLYGRRMYESMLYWETADRDPGQSAVLGEFTAVWQAAKKIVYSRTLETVSSARTTIQREFDADAVRQRKADAKLDLSVGGSGLAGNAIRFGLVDEIRVFIAPVVLGGGKSWLPTDVRSALVLVDTQRFASGAVFLRYRTHS